MGWSSGSALLIEIAKACREHMPRDVQGRFMAYHDILEAFSNHDCDTEEEALGIDPAMDVAILERTLAWHTKGGGDYGEETAEVRADLKKARRRMDRLVKR